MFCANNFGSSYNFVDINHREPGAAEPQPKQEAFSSKTNRNITPSSSAKQPSGTQVHARVALRTNTSLASLGGAILRSVSETAARQAKCFLLLAIADRTLPALRVRVANRL